MTKRFFIGANWKMNAAPAGAFDAGSPYQKNKACDVVVFPAASDLKECVKAGLITGGQAARAEEKGAFTGDISMAMLKAAGATHVLCGHSERRKHHGETDLMIAAQVQAALAAGLTAVLCIGETAEEQAAGETNDVLRNQLSIITVQASNLKPQNFVVAYEPVWAIGTGKTPTPADAENIHAFIRSLLPDQSIRIIYGGSVTGDNAKSFFDQKNIDGALVGGASLKKEEFAKIVGAAR